MSGDGSITQRFKTLPRAIQWLVFAVGFVVVFQGWFATVGVVVNDWNASSDKIERNIVKVRNSDTLTRDLEDLENAVVGLGPVQLPRRENAGRAALSDAVAAVLDNPDYSISDDDFHLRGGGAKLPKAISATIVDGEKRVSRVTGEVNFESSPEDAIAIVADFEARDDIESVTMVRITKAGGRKVKVQLHLEVWVEVPPRRK